MRLGVAIPTLNEAEGLPRLLARLFEADQADRADSVVVADGGSDDGTRDLARGAGAAVVDVARGRGVQLRAAGALLETDLLLFLHADCMPAPGALGALRAAFAADESLGAAAMAQRVDAPGRFYRLVERAADARCRRGMVYGDSGLCARRSAYEAVGGFRALPLFEDVDLSRRLAAHAPLRLVGAARLIISPRRWQREGRLKCTLRNWSLRLMYDCGVAPTRLARLYRPHGSS